MHRVGPAVTALLGALGVARAFAAPQPLTPTFNSLTLSGLPSAACLGTNSTGLLASLNCASTPTATTIGYVPTWSNTTGTAFAAGLPVGTAGASTVVETSPAGLIANSLIAALPNSALANSSMTLAGHVVALGGSQALAAADLSNGVTGSGAVVLGTSPTLTTPALGTPSAVVLTNATGLPLSALPSIGASTVLGNLSGASAAPAAVPVTQSGAASSLVETTAAGGLQMLLGIFPQQASAPALPSNGSALYSDSSNALNLIAPTGNLAVFKLNSTNASGTIAKIEGYSAGTDVGDLILNSSGLLAFNGVAGMQVNSLTALNGGSITAGSGTGGHVVLVPTTTTTAAPQVVGTGTAGLIVAAQNGAPVIVNSPLDQNVSHTLSGDTAPSAANELIALSQTMGGVGNSPASPLNINQIYINDAVSQAAFGAHTTGDDGISIVQWLKSGFSGGRIGVNLTLSEDNRPADLLDQFLNEFESTTRSSVNNGGVDNTERGATGRLFGGNFVADAEPGATYQFQVAAQENNCFIQTGASAAIRDCLALASIAPGTVQGSVTDAGLWIYGGGVGFRDAILMGGSQAWPVSPDGSIEAAQLALGNQTDPAIFGTDWRDATFPLFGTTQNGGAAFRTNGFAVDGGGTIREGRFYTSWTTNGLSIDGNGSIGNPSVAPAIDASSAPHFWEPLDLANDGYGGIIEVTAASAQAATVVSGGTGGTNGACTVTGTTGSGTLAQFSGTVTGGALTGTITVAVAGNYTAPIANDEDEPVMGCGLTGATLSVDLKPATIAWWVDGNGNIRAPTYPTDTPPANPVAVTAYSWSRGTGLAVDETWVTSPTTLALQSSGGAATLNGRPLGQWQVGNVTTLGTGLSLSSGTLTATGAGPITHTVRQITGSTTTTDTAGASDYMIVWDSSDAAAKSESISACSSANAGRELVVKDEYGNAGTYNITLTPASGTIEGAASDAITANHGWVRMTCDGGSNWMLN